MMDQTSALTILLVLLLVVALALLVRVLVTLSEVSKRVHRIQLQQQRRSIAWIRIQNDLESLMESTISLAKNDLEKVKHIEKILQVERARKLHSRLLAGSGASDHISGIEIPLGDEDAWFADPDWVDMVVSNPNDEDKKVK